MLQAWAEPGTNHNAKKHNHTKRHDFKIYTVYFFTHPTKKLVIIITPPRVQFDLPLLHTTNHYSSMSWTRLQSTQYLLR